MSVINLAAARLAAANRIERRADLAYAAYRAKLHRDTAPWDVLDTYERDAWRAAMAALDEGDRR